MSGVTTSASGTYTITLIPPVQTVYPGAPRCGTGPFAGMAPGALQVALSQAQQALLAVVTGTLPVTVDYAEGQGRRSVTYNRTNADGLRQVIRDLKSAIGFGRNGAIGFRL